MKKFTVMTFRASLQKSELSQTDNQIEGWKTKKGQMKKIKGSNENATVM